MSMLVIVPSRGRPQNIAELTKAWADTHTQAQMLVGLDDDDPTLGDYHAWCEIGPPARMVPTLNRLAVKYAPLFDHIGFLGDDVRPRTVGWDQHIHDALDELGTGIVYGNDLIHGPNLPTHAFMTSDIIRALGYMAIPDLWHLFLDNGWKALGETLGAIHYLPDVTLEHLHPIARKADWDEGYTTNNSQDTEQHDLAVYEQWLAEGLERDAAKIRQAAAA